MAVPESNRQALSARGATRAPLSPPQLRLWLHAQIDPLSSAYTMVRPYRIEGPLVIEALRQSLATIIERHEALRTTFHVEGAGPVQCVQAPTTFDLTVVDLSGQPDDRKNQEIDAFVAAEARRPFDLSRDLLIRAAVLRCAPADHVLVIAQHHIASDRWSVGNLHRELASAYRAAVTGTAPDLPSLPIQYADYAAWQHDRVRSEDVERQLSYWRRQLSGAPPFLELPAAHHSTSATLMTAGYVVRVLPPRLADAIEQLARANRATPFMALLAAWNVLIHRLTGVTDVVVGCPTAGRSEPQTERLIGFFANTLVLRSDISGCPTFVDYLQRVRGAALAAYDHQDVPFERLVETLNPVRDGYRTPLVQVLIGYQNVHAVPLTLHGLEVHDQGRHNEVAPFPLEIAMTRTTEGLQVRVAYQSEIFDRPTIGRWLGHFEVMLEDIVRNPHNAVTRLALMDAEERARVIDISRGRAVIAATVDRTADSLVADQVERTPDAVAIQAGSDVLTFRKLWEQAGHLAARLHAVGVERGHYVAILLPPSVDALVAILGTLRAGAAYVPLDPSHPPRRHALVLETVRPAALIAGHGQSISLPECDAPIVAAIADDDAAELDTSFAHDSANTAYVLFTSGSTGRPKGVALPHRALANLIGWHKRHERLGLPSRTLQYTPLTFDVSFQEIFTTWCTGGTVVLVDDDTRRDPAALLRAIAGERISRLYMPFVALRQLAAAARRDAQPLPALRDIISAGEVLHLPEDLRALLGRLGHCRLHNHYGPTEASVVATETLPAETATWPATAPIGRPIDGVTVGVVDRLLQPVPIGVSGEIVIGGICLADGYVGKPDLTRERFVEGSEAGSGRLYRTGDQGMWRADGIL